MTVTLHRKIGFCDKIVGNIERMSGQPDYIKLKVGPSVKAYSFPDVEVALKEFGTVVIPDQRHTANVDFAYGNFGDFPSTDALITNVKGLAIGVRTADCVPILLNAPDIGAVAAIHAGWKGTLAGIVRNAIDRLIGMGADPSKIYAAMGPCICGKCYEVGPELAEVFTNAGFGDCVFTPEGGREHLDLPAANRKILLDCGLISDHIAMPPLCTLESHGWPSWRRTPGTLSRLLTLIRISC